MAGPVSDVVIKVGHRRRRRLEKIVERPSSPQFLVLRARIVLLIADRRPLAQIAAHLGTTETTVRKWRDLFATHGIQGLVDLPRPGRPEIYGPGPGAAGFQRLHASGRVHRCLERMIRALACGGWGASLVNQDLVK